MDFRFKDFGYPIEIESMVETDNQVAIEFYSVISDTLYRYKCQINEGIPCSVGLTPFGGVAVWKNSEHKIELIDWNRAEIAWKTNAKNLADFAEIQSLFDNKMMQFVYRYQIFFNNLNDSVLKNDEIQLSFDFIEEALFDCTLDQSHDERLVKYHKAGKPEKLHLQVSMNKMVWHIYFWFDEKLLTAIFNRFYGAHPETKTDFIIRIDAENKKYELALYRQGLKEPVVIPKSAYQLIVFKNKFEDYRSENYNQPRGAWIW